MIPFDVNIHKWGFLSAQEFISAFANIPTPDVIYEGELTNEFVKQVVEGKFNVGEGVIVKGGTSPHGIWSAKIKTKEYLEKLKEKFKADWTQYW